MFTYIHRNVFTRDSNYNQYTYQQNVFSINGLNYASYERRKLLRSVIPNRKNTNRIWAEQHVPNKTKRAKSANVLRAHYDVCSKRIRNQCTISITTPTLIWFSDGTKLKLKLLESHWINSCNQTGHASQRKLQRGIWCWFMNGMDIQKSMEKRKVNVIAGYRW